MEALALPILAALVAIFVLFSIWVSVRNPPIFWMDERRIPDRLSNSRGHDKKDPGRPVGPTARRSSRRRR